MTIIVYVVVVDVDSYVVVVSYNHPDQVYIANITVELRMVDLK